MAKRSKKKKAPAEDLRPGPAATAKSPGVPTVAWDWKTPLPVVLFVALGFWIYWPSLHGGWLWDDDALVTGNANLRSLSGLGQSWFSTANDYWPLTWTLLWIEWHLWGNAPLGYRVCSLVLHLISGLLVWRLLGRLGVRGGWLGGLLFVIHPLAVESVAWIAEIKNTLSLPLYLLAFDAWLDGEEKTRSGYLRSVLFYLAAMLAKTSTVMLPAVLLLYCWWKRGRISAQELKRVIPFLALAVALGLLTIYLQTDRVEDDPVKLGGFVTRVIGAGTALFFYLGKFVLPVDLLPIYPRWTLEPPSLLQVLTLPALVALIGILWLARKSWGRHVLFGLGFFVLNLLPILGLVKMRYLNFSPVADHFVYLPMIGLIGLAVAGLSRLSESVPASFRLYGIGVLSMSVAWLAWESHGHASRFIDQETLWTYTEKYNPQTWVAPYNLGVAMLEQGRPLEAIPHLEQTLKFRPGYVRARNNLGNVFLQTGRTPEAVEQFEQALQYNPDDAGTRNNLGNALRQSGRLPEATAQYEEALKLKPDYAMAHFNLGVALYQAGRVPEAIEHFAQAVKIQPDFADARTNLTRLQALQQAAPASP